MNPYPNLNLNLNLNLNPNLNLNLNLNPNTNMAILMEDIRNYKKSKDDLYEYCENNGYTHEKMKSAIIYYMNDYSPCLYGISKNNYKKIRRITAYKIKEKKYIYLYSLILNYDSNPKTEINRYLGCLTTDERNLFLHDIMK
jgi:hypothetical protein